MYGPDDQRQELSFDDVELPESGESIGLAGSHNGQSLLERRRLVYELGHQRHGVLPCASMGATLDHSIFLSTILHSVNHFNKV